MKKLLFSTISILGFALLLSCGLIQTVAAAGTATLTVDFPGISSVHTYVKVDDGVVGTASGAQVAALTYQNGQAVFASLVQGTYDVVVVKGAEQKIIDAVDCTSGTCLVNGIVATLTVNFPSISSVHTYVKTTAGGDVDNQTYKTDSATLKVLKALYKVTVVKGAQQNVYDADCTSSDTCTVDSIVAQLTVNFPGISSVHTYVKTLSGGDVDNRTYKNDSASLVVLKSTYKVVVVKGAQQNTYELDCSAGDCTLESIIATMTVKFPGISSVHTYVKTDDGIARAFGGGDVDNKTYQNNETSLTLLKGIYDVKVVKGAQGNIYDAVDCTSGTCTVDNIVATLNIKYPGITSVHNYVKVPDGIDNSATGGAVDERTYQNNETSLVVLRNFYDVLLVKGSESFIYDNVDCTGVTCTLDKANLTVKFPGISNVHTYVRKSDGVAGSATGVQVAAQTWKTDQAPFLNLPNGVYDIVVVKGAKTKIIDNVIVLGNWAIVDKIVATLTVKFPGISNVHTYVKVDDGVDGTAIGGAVDERTWKINETSLAVLKNTYDVVVVKGAKTKIIDAVNCESDTCTVDNIVANLTVNFPGISSVHTYVKVNDGVGGTAAGGAVDERTWKTDKAELVVLRNTYDVVVVKGAKTKIIDDVDCTGETCTVENIVATLTVKFTGISSVHTYVKVNDGVDSTATGGAVDERTWKTNETSLVVLKNTYDVVVVKGAKTKIIDAVNCTGDTCLVDNIVATLTVNFPGISSVHTYVKVDDTVAGTATGGAVDQQTWKTNSASMVVLKNTYDVVVVKGAKTKIIDAVNCTGDTCLVEGIVATLTVKFPGISSVHTYVKTDDGNANSATGGAVDQQTWKTDSTSIVVLKNTYDVVVVKGAKQKIIDAVNCESDTCTVDNIVSNVTLHFPGKTNVHVYFKVDDGLLNSATGGAVDERTWKKDKAELVVLKNTYDIVVNLGGVNYILDAVDCTNNPAVYSLAIVKLINSSGTGIAGGVAKYYTGTWKPLGTTPASGALGVAIPGTPANILFSMDNNFVHNEKWQNIGTDLVVVFQTKNVEVQLKNSSGALSDTGTVKFYTGAWHDLGNTSGGKVNVELLPANILFSMDNNFVHNEKWQDVGANPTVVFQTKNVVIDLEDSGGNLILDSGGTGAVRYYTGAWHSFGSGTTSGGTASMELLPSNILFGITYQYVYNEKWQNTTGDANVLFQTKNVVVELRDHNNTLIADIGGTGVVRYYTGAWHDFGITSNGTISKELLPASILFGITHQYVYKETWQTTNTNPTVIFQTGQVNSGTGTCIQYYTGSWHPFTNGMELLSASILFKFNDANPQTWFTPVAGIVNSIH